MKKIMSVFLILCLISPLFAALTEKEEITLELLRILPEGSREYRILERFHTKEFLKKEDFYRKDMILTAKDVALITVLLVVKVDEIRDFGLEYYLTFDELKDLLYLVNSYSTEICLLLPEKMEKISEKVTRLEKRLNLEVKTTDEKPG